MSRFRRAGTAARQLSSRAAEAIRSIAAAIDLADTARPLRNALTREQWLTVGQEVTTSMLEGADVEEALALIADRLRKVAEADACCLVLPGVGTDWVIEFVAGDDEGDLLGLVMPADGRTHHVLRSRAGMIVRSLERTLSLRVPQFGRFGPALYAPLVVGQRSTGVIILLRAPDAPEFTTDDLHVAESFARQAALALELAEAREAQDRAALLDERARIARDLHDLAIQHLFATGLSISHARDTMPPGRAADSLGDALTGLDEAVAQIRSIVYALQRDAVPTSPLERLHRELALARGTLGFSPQLELLPSDADVQTWAETADTDLIDDVIAVVREGLSNAARHARANTVSIRVEVVEELAVTAVDDGVGIPTERTRSSGLRNLEVRAQRWGGVFEIVTGEGAGTTTRWRVPVRADSSRHRSASVRTSGTD